MIEDRFAHVIDASRRVAWAKFYAEREFNANLLADLQVLVTLVLDPTRWDNPRDQSHVFWAQVIETMYGKATEAQVERALDWAWRRWSVPREDVDE